MTDRQKKYHNKVPFLRVEGTEPVTINKFSLNEFAWRTKEK